MKADNLAITGMLMWIISFICAAGISILHEISLKWIIYVVLAVISAIGLILIGYAAYLKDLKKEKEE